MPIAKQVQLRRSSATLYAATAFIGVQGEMTFNTDTKRAEVHDGATVGGQPIAFANEVGNARLFKSAGDPNGAVVGKVGDLCVRMDDRSLLIKTSGDNTNTGWE